MLLYHPAFDIYHGIFRMLCILSYRPNHVFEIQRLRIFDFYLLFPDKFYKFRFPKEFLKQKNQFRLEGNPYEEINDPKRIFFRLEPYQMCSLKCLVAHQFIDADLFLEGKIQRTKNELPIELNNTIESAKKTAATLVEFLTGPLLEFDLYGDNGLKRRSNLFDYSYEITNSTTSS